MGKSKSLVIELNYEGKESLISCYKMNNGQIFGVDVSRAEVFENLYSLIYIIVSVIIIWLIISILIALYVSRKISKPIEECSKHMKVLAMGDFTQQVSEVGVLLCD